MTKLIKPAWIETLKFAISSLSEDKAAELIEIISEDYFLSKMRNGPRDYNPYLDNLCLATECLNEKGELASSENKSTETIIDEFIDLTNLEITPKPEIIEDVRVHQLQWRKENKIYHALSHLKSRKIVEKLE